MHSHAYDENSGPCSLFLIALPVLLLLGLLLTACTPVEQQRSLSFSGPTMGTDFRITVVLDPEYDENKLFSQVQIELAALEQKMSTYIAESEVSRFNRSAAGQAFDLSEPTADVVRQALSISAITDGYFDITVGPLVNAWGFGAAGRVNSRPPESLLQTISQAVGYQKLALQGVTLSKQHDDLEIDLSAIAKGYAVDRIAELLQASGVQNFLVNIGGELRAAGLNVDQQLWRVGIENPELLGGVAKIVQLDNQAIATSGDYRNFALIDGQKYSHTIDPLKQQPVLHRLALVSVLSDTASTADALATAMMAMGEERAQAYARREKIAAYFVIRGLQSDHYQIEITPEFMPNLQ